MRLVRTLLAAFLVLAASASGQAPEASRLIKAHDGLVYSIAFSPDGKSFATAGFDNLVKIWEYPSLKEVRKVSGHTGGVTCVAFNKDGTLLASSSQDKTIRLSNPADGKLVKELKGHTDGIETIAFSPDGKLLASGGGDKSVRLWSPAEGKELKNLGSHAKSVFSVAFSGDGKLLASGGADGVIKIYDVASQKELRQLKGHADTVSGLAWVPGNNTALVSISHDRTVRLWDAGMGKETKKLGEMDPKSKDVKPTEDDPYGIAFARDGKGLITSGYGGHLYQWDLSAGKAAWTRKLKVPCAYCVVFAPDGKAVLTGHDKMAMHGEWTLLVTPLGK
jgi:WD40 repeat protein